MTIEELERRYQEAAEAARDAQSAAHLAKMELTSAKLDATGLRGHKVSYLNTSWRDRVGTEVFFVVERWARWGNDLEGPMVKKDGTLGAVAKSAHPTVLTDHGLYTAPGTTP